MAKMNRVMNNNEKFIFVNYEVLQKLNIYKLYNIKSVFKLIWLNTFGKIVILSFLKFVIVILIIIS